MLHVLLLKHAPVEHSVPRFASQTERGARQPGELGGARFHPVQGQARPRDGHLLRRAGGPPLYIYIYLPRYIYIYTAIYIYIPRDGHLLRRAGGGAAIPASNADILGTFGSFPLVVCAFVGVGLLRILVLSLGWGCCEYQCTRWGGAAANISTQRETRRCSNAWTGS